MIDGVYALPEFLPEALKLKDRKGLGGFECLTEQMRDFLRD